MHRVFCVVNIFILLMIQHGAVLAQSNTDDGSRTPLIEVKGNNIDWYIPPVDGAGRPRKDSTIHGRVFTAAVLTSDQGHIVFPNRDGYEYLEVWIGRTSWASDDKRRAVTFRILGDGEQLYRSPKPMMPNDQAIRVRVSIKGRSGVSFTTENEGDSGNQDSLWADPTFIKTSQTSEPLVDASPSTDANPTITDTDSSSTDAQQIETPPISVLPTEVPPAYTRPTYIGAIGAFLSVAGILLMLMQLLQRKPEQALNREIGAHDNSSKVTPKFIFLGLLVTIFGVGLLIVSTALNLMARL